MHTSFQLQFNFLSCFQSRYIKTRSEYKFGQDIKSVNRDSISIIYLRGRAEWFMYILDFIIQKCFCMLQIYDLTSLCLPYLLAMRQSCSYIRDFAAIAFPFGHCSASLELTTNYVWCLCIVHFTSSCISI